MQAQYDEWVFHRVDSLSDLNYNYYIYKDSYGFVWISSILGLNRYDGIQTKVYTTKPNAAAAIADNNIHSTFFEDQDSNLWFATNEAIHVYNRKTDAFKKYGLKGGSTTDQSEYQLFFLDTTRQQLRLRNQRQMFVWIKKKTTDAFEKFELDVQGMNRYCAIQQKPDGTILLFIPGLDTLYVNYFTPIEQGRPKKIKVRKFYTQQLARTFFYDNERTIWIGTNQGLLKSTPSGAVQKIPIVYNGNPIQNIVKILPLENGKLLIATEENGIFIFNKTRESIEKQIYIHENNRVIPFRYTINEMYLDRDQTLWISCPALGVLFTNLNKKKFQSFLQNATPDSYKTNNVKSIAEDASGQLWCLTQNGVKVLDQNGYEISRKNALLKEQIQFSANGAHYIYCDKENKIWIGIQGGLLMYEPFSGPATKIPLEEGTDAPIVVSFITQLPDGQIFVSTANSSVYQVIKKNKQHYLRRFSPLQDSTGTYTWIFESKAKNLFFYKYNTFLSVYHRTGGAYIKDTIISFRPIIHGVLEQNDQTWLATSTGLFTLRKQQGSFSIERDTLFPNKAINGMLLDKAGFLWCSSIDGLWKYKPGGGLSGHYTVSDGLQASDFNFGAFLKKKKRIFCVWWRQRTQYF